MKRLLFLSIVILLFTSCRKDCDIAAIGKDVNLKIRAFYTAESNPQIQKADVNSRVFLYKGFYSIDLLGFSFEKNGVLIKGDSLVLPNHHITVEANGEATIRIEELNEPLTVIVESYYYKRLTTESYSTNTRGDIVFSVVFNH